GVDSAEEAGGEIGPGLGDERDTVAGPDFEGKEAPRMGEGVFAQLGIGVAPIRSAPSVMEVDPAPALGGIVERFSERVEVGGATRQAVQRGRCARRSKLAHHRGVAFEHAVPSFIVHLLRPRPSSAAGAFLMGGECVTKTAQWHLPGPSAAPRRSTPGGCRNSRCAMSAGTPPRARSSAPISRARSANGDGTKQLNRTLIDSSRGFASSAMSMTLLMRSPNRGH